MFTTTLGTTISEAAPVLVEVDHNGTKIPALVEVSKQGLGVHFGPALTVSRFTVWKRGPSRRATSPANSIGPPEPFSVGPRQIGSHELKPERYRQGHSWNRRRSVQIYSANSDGGLHNDGPFTRYGLKGSIVFPGTIGASNWHGTSYNPDLGYVFVNIMELADIGKLEKKPEGSPMAYTRSGYGRFWNSPDTYWPCQVFAMGRDGGD